VGAMGLTIDDGVIAAIHPVANPDKLRPSAVPRQ
jgi:hypothetical protein